jgi:hypothetical protein
LRLKSGRKILIGACLLGCGGFVVRGELEPWLQHTAAGPVLAALFRTVAVPGGAVAILRPPAESRPALTNLISATPRDAMLYRLRAQEAEVALDFVAAEADWKTYAQTAADRYGAQIELADFYDRRIRPRDELAALTAAAAAKDDPLLPVTAQRGWRAFERMAALESAAEPVFRAWVARYPQEPEAWRKLIEHLAATKQFAAAETEIARYGRAFHDDPLEPVKMRADLEMRRGSGAALAVYDLAFQPLWPEEMRAAISSYWRSRGSCGNSPAGRARRWPRTRRTWTPPRGCSTIFARRTTSLPRAACIAGISHRQGIRPAGRPKGRLAGMDGR